MLSRTLAVVMNITLREVERHAKVVVAKGRVLLGVEHSRSAEAGIAVDAAAELVDLVEHHHAIARSGSADPLNDVARQRADVGAAVAADFGFVVGAAEADPDKFAAGCIGDALSERGLADTGRPDKAQDRAAPARVELLDRQVFEDPPFDLAEPVMVFVEDPPCLGDIDRFPGFTDHGSSVNHSR